MQRFCGWRFENYLEKKKGNEQYINKTTAQGLTNVFLQLPRIIITYTNRKNTHIHTRTHTRTQTRAQAHARIHSRTHLHPHTN